ncbi:MAG TPA: nuclear transport factor 2 family protein [Gaiellaceae bacterium]|nr:nuclear transport factor 2 family protein [Gaiellaceae bacterium]
MNEAEPVERQVDAYNRRDIDAFLACYSPDTVVEDATGTVVMRGRDAMRAAYTELFQASPTLRAEIPTRIRVGEYVIDEERITGRRDSAEEVRVVAIYHVKDGVIDHVQLFR